MSKPGKPPVFDGKAEAWPDWKSSMQAHLNSKDILDPLVEERPGQAVPGREWDRKRSKIHSELTLYTEGAARGIVRQYERRRGAEPALDGKGAWAALVAKYEHQGMAALVSVEQALDRLTLGSGRDPDLFFGKFEELCDRLDGQQPEAPDGVDPAVVAAREAARDKARVAKVLAKLPSEYGQLVTLLEAVDGLTYDVAKQRVRTFYLRGQLQERSAVSLDVSLSAVEQPFRGKCHRCGKRGHRKADCRAKPAAAASGCASGTPCVVCECRGHVIDKCPVVLALRAVRQDVTFFAADDEDVSL